MKLAKPNYATYAVAAAAVAAVLVLLLVVVVCSWCCYCWLVGWFVVVVVVHAALDNQEAEK